MKINRNMVANALMITALVGGASATATANPTAKTTQLKHTRTTKYAPAVTLTTIQSHTIVTATDNTTQ